MIVRTTRLADCNTCSGQPLSGLSAYGAFGGGEWEAWCYDKYKTDPTNQAKCLTKPMGIFTLAPWTDVGAAQRGLPKAGGGFLSTIFAPTRLVADTLRSIGGGGATAPTVPADIAAIVGTIPGLETPPPPTSAPSWVPEPLKPLFPGGAPMTAAQGGRLGLFLCGLGLLGAGGYYLLMKKHSASGPSVAGFAGFIGMGNRKRRRKSRKARGSRR